MGGGLGSFAIGAVDGFFKGRDIKEGREDRRRLRTMDDTRFEWEKEDRENSRDDRKIAVSERDRIIKRREEEEAFWKSLVEEGGDGAANGGVAASPRRITSPSGAETVTAPDAPVTAAPPQAPTAAPGQAAPVAPAPARQPPSNFAQPSPARQPGRSITAPSGFFTSQADQLGAPPDLREIAGIADQAQTALLDPAIPPDQKEKASGAVAKASALLGQFAAMKAGGPQQGGASPVVGPAPGSANVAPVAPPASGPVDAAGRTPEQIADANAPVTNFEGRYADRQPAPATGAPLVHSPSQPGPAPAQPAMPMAQDGGIMVPGPADARTPVQAAPRQINMAAALSQSDRLAPQDRKILAARAGVAAQDEVAGNRSAAVAPIAENRQYAALQPGAPAQPGNADVPVTAQGTPKLSTASLEAATPRTIVSPDASEKTKAAAASKVQATFIEDYAKNQVPKIVKFYLGRGEVEKAQAYQDWAEETSVKAGMKYWAAAVHAASIGDDEGFVEGVAAAYNAKGYFDDGTSIVREASGIQRDPKTGAVTGAQVTFRDDATGKLFMQEFDGTEDIYRMGVDMLSPEQVFEQGWSRVEAADSVRDAAAKEIAKRVLGNVITTDAVLEAIKKLSEANLSFGSLPLEDQVAKAIELLQQFGGQAGPSPNTTAAPEFPVAARPAG